jgi:hypothetical protein
MINPFLSNKLPYELEESDKRQFLFDKLLELDAFHVGSCEAYKRISQNLSKRCSEIEDFVYIPAPIFKQHELLSVSKESIKKVISSSSTSSNTPSKVFFDQKTLELQRVSVYNLLKSFIGDERRPYIIFDDIKTARGKNSMSARGAALMSLMGFSKKFFFVMKEENGQLNLDMNKLSQALDYAEKEGGFISYGFTWILHLVHEQLLEQNFQFDASKLKNVFFLHSGGWKKLVDKAVDKTSYNRNIANVWNIKPSQVIDFYGMAELVGLVFPDCEFNLKHVPYYSDIIVRDVDSFEPVINTPGYMQFISLLGQSGPTHSILTEDIGEIVSVDSCACGRKGKAFRFIGRSKKAEVRGCGDIYASK